MEGETLGPSGKMVFEDWWRFLGEGEVVHGDFFHIARGKCEEATITRPGRSAARNTRRGSPVTLGIGQINHVDSFIVTAR